MTSVHAGGSAQIASETKTRFLEAKIKSLEDEVSCLSSSLKEVKDNSSQRLQHLAAVVASLQKENDSYGKNVKRLVEEKKTLEEKNRECEMQIHILNEDNKTNTGALADITERHSKLQSKARKLEEEITAWRSELRVKIQELGKLAGAGQTYFNPNIADLCDEIRPTKLAEEFSELYDFEWTDAFEVIDVGDEKEKTQIMLDILERAYHLCYDTSQSHMRAIKHAFATLTVRDEANEAVVAEHLKSPNDVTTKGVQTACYKELMIDFERIPNEQKKCVLDVRKFVENQLSEKFEQVCTDMIVKGLSENMKKSESVIKYVQRCLKLCWSMCRHEPPLHIFVPTRYGDVKYDTNMFKPYTKVGKYLDFVVWPVLYLHEGGPMLSKGVAQGRK